MQSHSASIVVVSHWQFPLAASLILGPFPVQLLSVSDGVQDAVAEGKIWYGLSRTGLQVDNWRSGTLVQVSLPASLIQLLPLICLCEQSDTGHSASRRVPTQNRKGDLNSLSF